MEFEVGKFYKWKDGSKVKCLSLCGKEPSPIVFQSNDGCLFSIDKCSAEMDLWREPVTFDWSCLAKWHNWIGMSANGDWYALGGEPKLGRNYWIVGGHHATPIPSDYAPKNYPGNWRDSLFERPKRRIPKPRR